MATTNEEILSLKAWVIKDTNNHRGEAVEITVIRLSDALNALSETRADTVKQILGELQKPIEDVINNFEFTSEDDPLADAIIRLYLKFEDLKKEHKVD